MKRTRNIRNTLYVFAIITAIGCKKLIEIPVSSPNKIVTEQVFSDSLSATNAVVGIYASNFSTSGVLSGSITPYAAMSADELFGNSQQSKPFYNNALVAGAGDSPGGSAGGIWNGYYAATVIYQANACIEGLSVSKTLSTTLKNRLIGECKIVRSLAYFNLTNLFGAVPIATTTDYLINSKLSRESQDSVFAFITKDLTDAATLLPATYVTSGRARPNKYSALALLSKVYLYTKHYDKAETAASQIINSGVYELVSDLNKVFLTGSKEAIWQAPVVGGSNYATAEGGRFIPYSSTIIPPYYLTDNLLNAFEPGDQRKVKWIKSQISGGKTYYYPYKYKNTSSFPSVAGTVEDYMMFRLGDLYLIRAEARFQQANLAGGTEDLNLVRKRAGLLDTEFISEVDLITAVLHERQVELCFEWANRWYDLKRSGKINAVMTAAKPGLWPADGHAALYPIPNDQIKLNPNLTQNSGY